jgi:hypothetical protein
VPEEELIARIGDREITVNEYIQRTELTVRPQYPALNDEERNNILLNNLIAEKLMAIDAGNENPLVQNEIFKAMIQGIKEQTMRERLYYKQGLDKVDLDSCEIKEIYPLAGREYKVAYYTINNNDLAAKIEEELGTDKQLFEQIFIDMTDKKKIPEKSISFKDSDPEIVHDALFSEPLEPGKVIGPLKVDENYFLVMKVLDWKFFPTIGRDDIQKRWNEVSEKLKQKKAGKIWQTYIHKIMKGRRIEFKKETFIKLSDMFFELQLQSETEQRREMLKNFLKNEDEIIFDEKSIQDNLLEQSFFSIDGRVWTVQDFRKLWLSHPLVYRAQAKDKRSFYKQFRQAIIDMIADYYLTKEAYKQSIDKEPEVRKTTIMWHDANVASFHKEQYLKSIVKMENFDLRYMRGKNNYLSFYIDSLQKKYSNEIEINFEKLKDIRLTKIQMFTIRQNVPYPNAVPVFSEYIQDGEIDYGRGMRKKK